MNFKEFIHTNKKELEHQEDLSSVWNSMEEKLPTASTNTIGLSSRKSILLLVAGILLISGFFITKNSFSKTEKQNSSFAQLKNKPAVEKILFIKTSAFDDNHKTQIITTLLDIAKNDESKNVQLTALRALEKYIEAEEVKIALINLLSSGKEPYLTVAILNILQRGKVKESLPAFNQIIQDNSNLKFVQEEAVRGQAYLKNI